MQLAHREMSELRMHGLVWLLLTLVEAVAGPFGTMEAMGPLARTLYRGAVTGISIGANALTSWLVEGRSRLTVLSVWTGFVVVLSTGLHLVNMLVFAGWGSAADWAYLTGTVGMVTVAVHLVVWMARRERPVQSPLYDAQAAFQRRLPFEMRAALVRIEAQDHYLTLSPSKAAP